MSIEVTSLDFPPHVVALQAAHVLRVLIEYPSTLLVLYLLYRYVLRRTFATPVRWLRSGYDRARRRFGRAVFVLANVAVVSPLVYDALRAGIDEPALPDGSVLTEVAGALELFGLVLLTYAVW